MSKWLFVKGQEPALPAPTVPAGPLFTLFATTIVPGRLCAEQKRALPFPNPWDALVPQPSCSQLRRSTVPGLLWVPQNLFLDSPGQPKEGCFRQGLGVTFSQRRCLWSICPFSL